MKQLLALIENILGDHATDGLLVKIGFRAAAIVPGLLDGNLHLDAAQLDALSEVVLDAREGRL